MRDLDAGGAFGVISFFGLMFMCLVVYVHRERGSERRQECVGWQCK